MSGYNLPRFAYFAGSHVPGASDFAVLDVNENVPVPAKDMNVWRYVVIGIDYNTKTVDSQNCRHTLIIPNRFG